MRLACLATLLALAACDSAPDKGTLPDPPEKPFAVKDNAATKRVDENAEGSAAPVFALMPDGLMVTHGTAKGRPVTLLRFGDPEDQTTAALAKDLGKPEASENSECDTGSMTFADFGVIKTSFQKGKFVGWTAESGKGLKVGEGVSPDKPFRYFERTGARIVPNSTLDGEFVIDGSAQGTSMGGFLDAGEQVRMLYAGSNCFFR